MAKVTPIKTEAKEKTNKKKTTKKDLKTKKKASGKKITPKNTKEASSKISSEDLQLINSKAGLKKLYKEKGINIKKITAELRYEDQLKSLQIELIKLQRDVQKNKRRVVIIFEGRDAAGKGGTIRRFIEHLNPRSMRVVALPKPTEDEAGQWYFQRYAKHLPNPGEICFFDRSWYNRAVVEPVMGFCSSEQYKIFLQQVPEFEHMLYEDGIEIVKFWFSISKDEQEKRFERRKDTPLKQWKISPVDEKAQKMWDSYTYYKGEMFSKTHTSYSPWTIVKANDKKKARLAAIRYVLSNLSYEGKKNADINLHPDPNIITRFHRKSKTID